MPETKSKSSGWCTPVVIYIILAILSIVATIIAAFTKNGSKQTEDQKITNIVVSSVWMLFWTWIMYELCKRGHGGWAWFVLLFPILLWLFMFLIILGVVTFGKVTPLPINV